MILYKFPEKQRVKIRSLLLFNQFKVNTLTLDEEMYLFASELKKNFSEEEIEKIAKNSKFIQRKGKLKAWEMVYLCCFNGANVAKDTLVTLASKISSNGGESLSSQAIDQRLNEKCVIFLKEIFTKLINAKISSGRKIQCEFDTMFKRIRILDATSFQVPEAYKDIYPGSGGSAQTAGVKIQLEFELKSGEFLNIDVAAGSSSDNTFGTKISDTVESKDLILRDLGYFSFEEFDNIVQKKAFYISRLKPNIAVYINNPNIKYYKNGLPKKRTIYKRINLKEIMKNMEYGETFEMEDTSIGRIKKLPIRLIIYKLSEEQLEERKKKSEKIAKKKGITRSQDTIDLLGITMYITNIPSEVLEAHKIYELYTLRWQVEILFKTWKSIFKLHDVKKVKFERFQCQLYGKLIMVLLASTIMFKMRMVLLLKQKKESSEIKSSHIIKEYISRLYLKLIKGSAKCSKILTQMFEDILKNGCKSRNKHKQTVFDIINVHYETNLYSIDVSLV